MTDTARRSKSAGASLSLTAVLALLSGVIVLAAGVFFWSCCARDSAEVRIVIATGPKEGNYHALGANLAWMLEKHEMAGSAEARTTEGSGANMAWVAETPAGGESRFALVQSDTPPRQEVRLVASLYEEVLHVVIARQRSAEIKSLADLAGRRGSLGRKGSGTRQVAEKLIEHFGIELSEDVALAPHELASALAGGRVDVVFHSTALPSGVVADLAAKDLVRFVSLGDPGEVGGPADALATVFPSLRATVIPRGTYGVLPEKPICAVGVSAQLLTGRSVEESVVKELVAALFENRSELAGALEAPEVVPPGAAGPRKLPLAHRIRESYDPEASVVPYHAGAVSYYQRESPSFFVEYAEAISLAMSLGIGIFSASIAFREWVRRRKKNRIDLYYLEVEDCIATRTEKTLAALTARRSALDRIRQRAFADLVAERLEADNSFVIFQDFIRAEVSSTDARIAELHRKLDQDASS